jgi:hypothetical protein
MVAINRMMSGWLTSGRITMRSTPRPATHHADGQREPGRHALSCSPTSVSAANTTMMPCAKLNTPDALKISTKPSAISAVERAGDEAFPQHLQQKVRRCAHLHEGIDEKSCREYPLCPFPSLPSAARPDRRRSHSGLRSPHQVFRRQSSRRDRAPPPASTGPSPHPCRARSARWWCRTGHSHRE